MKRIVQRLRARAADASGMSLIEVIVAISLMSIVATAAIGLSISSMKSAAKQQRQELAVTVANQAMEVVSAHASSVNGATGVSALYNGRAKTPVQTNWAANTGVAGTGATYAAWDPTATASSTPEIPITKVYPHSGTNYTAHTLIGVCYQPASGGDCTRIAGQAMAPSVAPAGRTALIRVMVVVRWSAGCGAGGCSYQTSTLIDSHSDLEWNTHE
ncbi:prepilin-type N-terminal cleavage/methylation domain-containing protein [Microbacterium sp. STN6]|uniref:type IV pilus modification PilV family protein n=1 Tax=Microbacterium sp. STN6 TaxID=2995588 RepID=UPI002260CFA9|nr:prepilin-type N-terminal cleavage/methylation domain-containing protein [Microbacterium sp. STN6]MCX7523186.1 prepilin-type N-terminal cleavage/methylation domain-containing protein [Microbacterium sp. STN6]